MPFGALLAASGAEKKKSGTALGRLGAKKRSKMGAKKFLRTPLFGVPDWGPNLDPHFIAFQKDFIAFQKHFQRFPRALSAAKIITDGLQGLIFQLPVWNSVPPGLQV